MQVNFNINISCVHSMLQAYIVYVTYIVMYIDQTTSIYSSCCYIDTQDFYLDFVETVQSWLVKQINWAYIRGIQLRLTIYNNISILQQQLVALNSTTIDQVRCSSSNLYNIDRSLLQQLSDRQHQYFIRIRYYNSTYYYTLAKAGFPDVALACQ